MRARPAHDIKTTLQKPFFYICAISVEKNKNTTKKGIDINIFI